MDQGSVQQLFDLQSKSKVGGVPEKLRSKSKEWCLIFWIDDKQVSIESLTSVGEDFRKEGEVSDIRFRGDGKKYPGKILRISEDKKKLQAEQGTVLESFEQHSTQAGADLGGSSKYSSSTSTNKKRISKKTPKLTEFTSQLQQEESLKRKTAIPKTAKPPKKVEMREARLKEVGEKAKAQQSLFKQMLTCKATKPDTLTDLDSESDDIIMEDLQESPSATIIDLEGQIRALQQQVGKLHKKLREKDLEISNLKAQAEPTPNPFSVAITPKKIRLMEEVTALLQSSEQSSSQSTRMDSRGSPSPPPSSRGSLPPRPFSKASPPPQPYSRGSPSPPPSSRVTLQPRPFSKASPPPLPFTRASPPPQPSSKASPPCTSAQNTSVTAADNSLTPLYAGGVPLLREQEKRLAFSKGTNKETLLFSLLVAVFGEERLAKGKACGHRQAHNSQDLTMPLDAVKLNEIKESVLRRFKTSSGQPCFSPKEFNEKINQKCSTVRRALKRQQAKQ